MLRLCVVLLLVSACLAPAPPVRIDGPPPPSSAPSGVRAPGPLRRLTRAQYQQSVVDLFAPVAVSDTPASRFPADEVNGPFLSNVTSAISPLEVDVTFSAAESLASVMAPNFSALSSCGALTSACARQTLEKLARRAWRRPVLPAESQRFAAMVAADARAGFELGLVAILASPSFLEVVEVGVPDGARVKLTGDEVAARLALLLRGGLPDDALLADADAGRLDTADGIAAATWRLLRDERAAQVLADFHLQWLGLGGLSSLDKDARRYPFFGPEVRQAMARELETFVDTVIRRSDGRLETLLAAPFSDVRGPLNRIYGLDGANGLTGLDPAQRRGLLTQPAFLAGHAASKLTQPVQRGVVLTRNLLCLPLGDPPPGVNLSPIGVDTTGQQTRRQLVEQHSTNPSCAGCHRVFDPLGLAFEHYDAVGAWREVDLDDGATIDAKVSIAVGDPTVDGTVNSATELIARLAKSAQVRHCAATQWFRYALGRAETPADAAELTQLQQRFDQTDGDLPDLLVALTTSDAFRSRAP